MKGIICMAEKSIFQMVRHKNQKMYEYANNFAARDEFDWDVWG